MAEGVKVQVPIGLNESPAQPAQEKPRPEWARKSIHNVRMSESILAAHRQPAPTAPPSDYAPTPQPPQAQENYMENQFNGNQQPQQPQAPQPPDPTMFDMFDPQHVAEFHRQNAEYYGSLVDQRVQAALQPSRQALNEAEAVEQYNRLFAKCGDDSNFKSTLDEALQLCVRDIQSGKPLDIEKRYLEVSESVSRRPGERLSHLPAKAKSVAGLGQLIDFHHRRGTARPFNGRNWRG